MTDHADSKLEEGIQRTTYRSFLVRCWQEADAGNGGPGWRFTLVMLNDERPQRGFASLDDLVAYLCDELGETVGVEIQEPGNTVPSPNLR